MRVIAGSAKGRLLIAPEGLETRPITAKIKEALFSSWQLRLYDCAFLDLFSGSGSMGIEALSRGAARAVFVEKSPKAADVIRKNLSTCKFDKIGQLRQEDVFDAISDMKRKGDKFDVIYLDPPFTVDAIFLPVMEALSDGALLHQDGLIAIRTLKEKEMPEEIGVLRKYRLKTYGISTIHFYEAANES